MGQIVKSRLADLKPGDAVVESMGRILFRLPDDVLTPSAAMLGLVPICDVSGNRMTAPGSIVVTGVQLDEFENLECEAGIVTLPRWQASVN